MRNWDWKGRVDGYQAKSQITAKSIGDAHQRMRVTSQHCPTGARIPACGHLPTPHWSSLVKSCPRGIWVPDLLALLSSLAKQVSAAWEQSYDGCCVGGTLWTGTHQNGKEHVTEIVPGSHAVHSSKVPKSLRAPPEVLCSFNSALVPLSSVSKAPPVISAPCSFRKAPSCRHD